MNLLLPLKWVGYAAGTSSVSGDAMDISAANISSSSIVDSKSNNNKGDDNLDGGGGGISSSSSSSSCKKQNAITNSSSSKSTTKKARVQEEDVGDVENVIANNSSYRSIDRGGGGRDRNRRHSEPPFLGGYDYRGGGNRNNNNNSNYRSNDGGGGIFIDSNDSGNDNPLTTKERVRDDSQCNYNRNNPIASAPAATSKCQRLASLEQKERQNQELARSGGSVTAPVNRRTRPGGNKYKPSISFGIGTRRNRGGNDIDVSAALKNVRSAIEPSNQKIQADNNYRNNVVCRPGSRLLEETTVLEGADDDYTKIVQCNTKVVDIATVISVFGSSANVSDEYVANHEEEESVSTPEVNAAAAAATTATSLAKGEDDKDDNEETTVLEGADDDYTKIVQCNTNVVQVTDNQYIASGRLVLEQHKESKKYRLVVRDKKFSQVQFNIAINHGMPLSKETAPAYVGIAAFVGDKPGLFKIITRMEDHESLYNALNKIVS
ncbi:hypothetical protein FRACYDRAFT_244791 [Fragilariopsis cylindrus CCMP1102]|uniref:RanBD1 domain-containing protein n=1 Tax=Fragilariopsis cylindrus CCMP1102 TaxID=635003 RepID=A0A1E7F0E7_9STRA|nr:hypothetical protein FRACYDRAFT_244791 [Fragilariopsis cylindrus CCMP1102]|eukprot:OEU11672.1 hypothetical protein FRACYDRAFT_244791 [Fragilariopsis cylindrus CCMP1102]